MKILLIEIFKKGLFVFCAIVLLCSTSYAFGKRTEPEELERLISKINERQSKNLKTFEKKTKAYFFEAQRPEVIEFLIKEFPPGEVIAVIVFSNLSKKPYKEIAAMRKAGTSWPDIAGKLKINLKAAVKEVKDFRLGIG